MEAEEGTAAELPVAGVAEGGGKGRTVHRHQIVSEEPSLSFSITHFTSSSSPTESTGSGGATHADVDVAATRVC